jgi:hypothetical protein
LLDEPPEKAFGVGVQVILLHAQESSFPQNTGAQALQPFALFEVGSGVVEPAGMPIRLGQEIVKLGILLLHAQTGLQMVPCREQFAALERLLGRVTMVADPKRLACKIEAERRQRQQRQRLQAAAPPPALSGTACGVTSLATSTPGRLQIGD